MASFNLTLDDVVQPAEGILTRDVPDGAVVVNPATGNAFELNESGAAVLAAIGAGGALSRAAAALVARWHVVPARAEADTLALASELLLRGLIVRAPPRHS